MTTTSGSAASVDFTELRGVGAKTAAALREAGVDSMLALAAMSVDDVVHALDEVGVQVSAAKIISKRWLQQAWVMSQKQAGPPVEKADDPEEEQELPQVNEGNDWHEHAGFFVYFDRSSDGARWRTRVWDTGVMIEQQIPSTAPDRWVNFILSRANLPSDAESSEIDGSDTE